MSCKKPATVVVVLVVVAVATSKVIKITILVSRLYQAAKEFHTQLSVDVLHTYC